ncbi:hypothetical protein ASU31_10690 [Pedobacter ginsenosidimutans]|uniref:Uncharacterized protein n=1 Tax=Pedobacter ginsenosidimutans TaxID=687842 RepID=A0A0T5VQH9_9SPHI|nr:hypothetical protein [Pedobacter ginsenosidimutans]KRT15967.1 hypothetical protein ASU31_10690 [Pedobacter ginsenosidimutans]
MKNLTSLTGSEKARLLHDLFPDEIPMILEQISAFCEDFKTNKEDYRQNWDSGFMSFNYWQSLAEETAGIIKKHGYNMNKSSRVFSDQLYFTYTSLFVTDRIIKYADKDSKNEKFKLIVRALFT